MYWRVELSQCELNILHLFYVNNYVTVVLCICRFVFDGKLAKTKSEVRTSDVLLNGFTAVILNTWICHYLYIRM